MDTYHGDWLRVLQFKMEFLMPSHHFNPFSNILSDKNVRQYVSHSLTHTEFVRRSRWDRRRRRVVVGVGVTSTYKGLLAAPDGQIMSRKTHFPKLLPFFCIAEQLPVQLLLVASSS